MYCFHSKINSRYEKELRNLLF